MENRVHNFSAGPATLPLSVLETAQRELLVLSGAGMSVTEISHRSKWYDRIYEEAVANICRLLDIPAGSRRTMPALWMRMSIRP